MIKMPKEVSRIVTGLSQKGYEIYCAGKCVTSSYMGEETLDWDLYTDCPQETLRELFEDGESIGTRVTRYDHTTEVISDDLNVADHLEGVIIDVVTLAGPVEELLESFDFTVEAIAENPQKKPVDPYNGREDIRKKILKPVSDNIGAVFAKAPIKMLKAISYVALYGFDLSKTISEAIMDNAVLLQKADKEDILEYFTIIIDGDHAGKALQMLAGLNLIQAITGPEAKLSGRGAKEYDNLTRNIDKTKHIPLRRKALFYLCYDGRKYKDVVKYLPHDEEDLMFLEPAAKLMPEVHFLTADIAIKKFLYREGWDMYNFIDKLSKAYVIVHEIDTQKITSRNYVLQKVIMEKQPIFIEDLAIDANDIMEAGITDDPERAEYLMTLLPDIVHHTEKKNTRDTLLKYAKRFHKNKAYASLRKVKWLR